MQRSWQPQSKPYSGHTKVERRKSKQTTVENCQFTKADSKKEMKGTNKLQNNQKTNKMALVGPYKLIKLIKLSN